MKNAKPVPVPAPSQTAPAWHCMTVAEVVGGAGTSLDNDLTVAEAAARLARHGANAILEAERRRLSRMLAWR